MARRMNKRGPRAAAKPAKTTRRGGKAAPKRAAKKATTRTRVNRAQPATRATPSKRPPTAAPPLPPAKRRLIVFHVDAFTNRPFHGNGAGVIVLDRWIDADLMQSIAAEHNLAETAFLAPMKRDAGACFGIRWFSPAMEIDLCGHATIAGAHVLWRHLGLPGDRIVFESASGPLPVRRRGEWIELDFPARPGERVNETRRLARALGREPVEVLKSRDYLAVFENKRDVHELTPDFAAIRDLDCLGVIVTAPGAGHDFVSRFFVPRAGIDEDPATGSSHCTLVPYWAARLGKRLLTAHQVSRRGGEFRCEHRGDRVGIAGRAVTYMEGTLSL
jgi:PhzF family phenazine biosynthesis protein